MGGGGGKNKDSFAHTHIIRNTAFDVKIYSIYTQQRSILQYVKGHRSLIYSADDWFCFVFVFFFNIGHVHNE
jgi:hypothetical protein